jgi:hypothetical protein
VTQRRVVGGIKRRLASTDRGSGLEQTPLQGALVQASVRERPLGIPLLRMDATVVLLAAITAP